MRLLTESNQAQFVSNGAKSTKNRFVERDICCNRYKRYQKKKADDDDAHHDIRLRNGSRNTTSNKLSKSTSTSLPVIIDEKCHCCCHNYEQIQSTPFHPLCIVGQSGVWYLRVLSYHCSFDFLPKNRLNSFHMYTNRQL